MDTLSGYIVIERIYESSSILIVRAVHEPVGTPVILKKLKNEFLSAKSISQFRSGFNIAARLDGLKIVRHLAIGNHESQFTIVLEDFGGRSLKQIMSGTRLSLPQFLALSSEIALIIASVHKRNVIHKDIKPDNFIVRPDGDAENWIVRLTDFHIASTTASESSIDDDHMLLQGSLPYISPEQTGRMNRSVDYRTDLYSLGVTLFEILTGRLPFTTSDPMEMLHHHIAEPPPAPHEIDPSIPRPVSAIIMKLMAKNPGERYRSAAGVAYDLGECLKRIRETGSVGDFTPGEKDVSDRFMLPDTLYGRSSETEKIAECFRAAAGGARGLLLVAGPSGIGKTSLVYELHKKTAAERKYFVSGKFNRDATDVPFSAFIAAFRELIIQILTESNESIRTWQKRIFDALYPNIRIITDVIPQLELITGPQPDIPEMGASESLNRFNLYFEKFVSIFPSAERPLVVFLDDLQWADAASLSFLKVLARNDSPGHFLLIGSFRDNEMTENHPLLSAIREIKSAGLRYDMLIPAPMDENDIAAMIADAFSLRGDRANSLASLIKSKTGGNPFFVREFLKKLYTEEYIRFDDQWMWDTGVISQAEITDNISSILIESLSRLDAGLRELLQVASCAGQRFDETVIAEASTTGRDRSEELLSTAVAEGLIIKTGSGYKFAHDRIQETIYATIRDGEKSRIHLRIAEIMLRAPEPEITDKVFQIAGHLNAARSDVEGELRHRAAEINARAGARARQAAAFDSVIPFYASALDFLSPDPWTGDYRLSLDLHTGLAESNYLTGRHGEGERFFASVLAHARNVLDTVEVYDLRISYLSSRRLFADALDTGRQALRRFGIRIPRTLNITPLLFELTRALMHTWKLGAEGISALPGLTDVKKLAISRLLVACIEPSYLGAPDSLPHIVLKLFNLAIRNGNSPYGAYSYVLYSGILMEIFGRIESVFRFGNLALEVIEKGDQRFLGSKINFIYGVGVRHWKWHVSEDLPYLQKSFNLASETGDLSYASYALHHLLINSFFSGEPLPDLIEKYANNYALMKKFNLLNTLQSFEQFYQFIVNLHSESEEEPSLSGKIFSEREVVPEWHETESLTVLGHYHVCRLMTLYLSGRFDEAVSAAGEGMRYLKAMMGLYFLPEFNFFHSLALIARCRSGKSRRRDIRAVKRNQRQMRKWAAQAPDNFRAKYELVESELNSLKQGMSAQLAGYDAAIGLFEKHGFLRDEALACELTFRFLLERGFPAIAETYLVRSLIAYKKWGCRFKSRILEKEYRAVYNRPFTGLFENIPGRHNPGLLIDSSTHFSVLFDINAIIKSSQALSREIHLHSLIESLMKIAIENAGAQKGVLIMQRGQNLFVEAEIHSSVRETSILGSKPLSQYVDRRGGGPGLPMSILNYVSRTMEDIVLDNAQAEYKFNSDPYISANGVKSVLCAPIAYQGELTGILYLENNVITGAFTPERIRVLKILSSQAAISLEIASLYEGLERLVDERTETIDQQKRELEHQIELAAQIQNALLPREIPSVSDISIAFRYLPMMNIGGDFLDIKTSDDDLGIGFFICDVSGHGVAAALIASMVKMSLSNWEETLSAPAETLKSLHNLLSAKIGRNFITAAICYIDLKSSRCTFASAGHTPFIIARRSGETEILHVRGRVINSLMTPEYREHVTDFNTGDTIILYTDGVVEAFNADRNLFGWDALLSLVKNNPGKSPDELCDSIIKAVSTFTGQTKSFDDDITILAIRHEDRGK